MWSFNVRNSAMPSKSILISILVSVWTIVQTVFHLTWAIFGYFMYTCRIQPTRFDLVFLYLTYFYRDECGTIKLESEDFFISKIPLNCSNGENTTDVYLILQSILNKAILPKQSNASMRAYVYIYIFILMDVMWACSAIALLLGACCKFKKCWLVLVNGLWIIVTAIMILLDVVSAVHFGLDIIHLYNYTSWLKFIGVVNYKDFSYLNDYQNSHLLPTIPSTVLCGLFSRLFLIWLINIICLFAVLHITSVLYQEGQNNSRTTDKTRTEKIRCSTGEELDLNSSEARIRNWQLFYGAVESSSTLNSSSSIETDYNSNSRISEKDTKFTDSSHCNRQTASDNVAKSSMCYRKYPDVASCVEEKDPRPSYLMKYDSLRNQLPWSYFSPQAVRRNERRKQYKHDVVRSSSKESLSNVETVSTVF